MNDIKMKIIRRHSPDVVLIYCEECERGFISYPANREKGIVKCPAGHKCKIEDLENGEDEKKEAGK